MKHLDSLRTHRKFIWTTVIIILSLGSVALTIYIAGQTDSTTNTIPLAVPNKKNEVRGQATEAIANTTWVAEDKSADYLLNLSETTKNDPQHILKDYSIYQDTEMQEQGYWSIAHGIITLTTTGVYQIPQHITKIEVKDQSLLVYTSDTTEPATLIREDSLYSNQQILTLAGLRLNVPQNWKIQKSGTAKAKVTDPFTNTSFTLEADTLTDPQDLGTGQYNVMDTIYGTAWEKPSTESMLAYGIAFQNGHYFELYANFGAHTVTTQDNMQLLELIERASLADNLLPAIAAGDDSLPNTFTIQSLSQKKGQWTANIRDTEGFDKAETIALDDNAAIYMYITDSTGQTAYSDKEGSASVQYTPVTNQVFAGIVNGTHGAMLTAKNVYDVQTSVAEDIQYTVTISNNKITAIQQIYYP